MHPESEIEFTRKDFLQPPDKYGAIELTYMLPGISASEFANIVELNMVLIKN